MSWCYSKYIFIGKQIYSWYVVLWTIIAMCNVVIVWSHHMYTFIGLIGRDNETSFYAQNFITFFLCLGPLWKKPNTLTTSKRKELLLNHFVHELQRIAVPISFCFMLLVLNDTTNPQLEKHTPPFLYEEVWMNQTPNLKTLRFVIYFMAQMTKLTHISWTLFRCDIQYTLYINNWIFKRHALQNSIQNVLFIFLDAINIDHWHTW